MRAIVCASEEVLFHSLEPGADRRTVILRLDVDEDQGWIRAPAMKKQYVSSSPKAPPRRPTNLELRWVDDIVGIESVFPPIRR